MLNSYDITILIFLTLLATLMPKANHICPK